MLLWFCLFYDTARCCIVIVRFFFETMDRLIRRLSSCFAYDLNRYDVMRTQPQECTRRTHAVSCGWTNVHDMMHNESYIRTQRTSTSKLLHAPCSYKHWAATASLLLGIFFGFIFHSTYPTKPGQERSTTVTCRVSTCLLTARLVDVEIFYKPETFLEANRPSPPLHVHGSSHAVGVQIWPNH